LRILRPDDPQAPVPEPELVPKIVDRYMEGKIEIDPMITHTMPLTAINQAFDLMHSGQSIRSVVVY
jgi:S-(hydroxymethyl)glutathione dehydrogenase / alcohol dehydrogenase